MFGGRTVQNLKTLNATVDALRQKIDTVDLNIYDLLRAVGEGYTGLHQVLNAANLKGILVFNARLQERVDHLDLSNLRLQKSVDDILLSNTHLQGKVDSLLEVIVPLEDQVADLRGLVRSERIKPNPFRLETEYPIAFKSNDHLRPRGTKNDNTRSSRFCRAVEQHFQRSVVALDLGCAGGGLVFDFLIRGHLAMGLEGSDYSLQHQRAEWRIIPDYLRTCDATKPFVIRHDKSGHRAEFDVISAWEFMEHIHEHDMPSLFSNIKAHLAPAGLFVGSVPFYHDIGPDGTNYHHTVKPETWWKAKFAEMGMKFIDTSMFGPGDYVRGSGNGKFDLDFSQDPSKGFHFVAQHASA